METLDALFIIFIVIGGLCAMLLPLAFMCDKYDAWINREWRKP